MANISLAVWLMALAALSGCSNQVVTQAAGDGGADGRDVEIGGAAGGGATNVAGRAATGGAVAVAGATSLAATGGVSAATGGVSAAAGTAGSVVVTIKACLVSVKAECLCVAAYNSPDIATNVANCKAVLDCWKMHNCGPKESCSALNATAPCSEYNYDSATWDIAKTTYACACQ